MQRCRAIHVGQVSGYPLSINNLIISTVPDAAAKWKQCCWRHEYQNQRLFRLGKEGFLISF